MNRSEKPRMSATVQYCQPYVSCGWPDSNSQMLMCIQIRPVENQILAVDPRRLPEIPPRIVEMMGYRIHKPFIGYGWSKSVLSGSHSRG